MKSIKEIRSEAGILDKILDEYFIELLTEDKEFAGRQINYLLNSMKKHYSDECIKFYRDIFYYLKSHYS